MPKFEVKFDGTSFTDNPNLTELELDETEIASLNEKLKSSGELPASVLGVIEARTSPDDAQENDDCKVFMTVTLLVEAGNARAALHMDPPEAFLNKVVSAMTGEAGSLELDGVYEVLDVVDHETQETVY